MFLLLTLGIQMLAGGISLIQMKKQEKIYLLLNVVDVATWSNGHKCRMFVLPRNRGLAMLQNNQDTLKYSRRGTRTPATSKMDYYVKLVNT